MIRHQGDGVQSPPWPRTEWASLSRPTLPCDNVIPLRFANIYPMNSQKPRVVDPFPSPKWLVPHKHPEVFRRQALGVRFRWPAFWGWAILAAGVAVAFMTGWLWVAAVPFMFLVGWSGILTNKGKPLQGGVLLLVALVGANIAIIAAAIAWTRLLG